MEAIVLAGGLGTRLKKRVPDLPKSMALISGRPFMEILLGKLSRSGFTRVVLSLGYMSEKLTAHFGHSYRGVELVYEVERQPLGTGGAIRAALAHCRSDHVFVFNGDTYLDLEVDEVESMWRSNLRPIIVVRAVDDIARYGGVQMSGGRVIAFHEKGRTGAGLINAGCYVLPKNAPHDFPPEQHFSFERDYLIQAVQRLHFDGFVTGGYFIDIGVPEDYARAQIELAGI